MKVIIDIPSKEFGVDIRDNFQDFFKRVKVEIAHRIYADDTLLCGNYELETSEMFLEAFKNMQTIPKVITNGDMIQAMFPNGKYGTNGNFVHVYIPYFDIIQTMTFDLSWWNTPYKKEVEE